MDQINATGATIVVLEDIINAGVKSLDQAAIDQLNKTKTDVETILNMGVANLLAGSVGPDQRTVATIDVLENIQNEGGVKSLDQPTIDQLNKTETDVETILNMGVLPTFTQAQLDQINATSATIDVLENIQNRRINPWTRCH